MLSICTTNRDDDYESDAYSNPISRFYDSLRNNCKSLSSIGLDYEYIVANWNPDKNKLLSQNAALYQLFKNYPIKEIVIEAVTIKHNGMNPSIFQEYYAKNVAVRESSGENLLIINHDIILPRETWFEIKELIFNGLNNYFYRCRYRNGVDLYNLDNDDGYLCAGYSGDFLLIKKDIFPGYDETNPGHTIGRQNSMDGELLWQLDKNGVKLKMLKNGYIHLDHPKTNSYDSTCYNKDGYQNKSNWGFLNYPKHYISPSCIIV